MNKKINLYILQVNLRILVKNVFFMIKFKKKRKRKKDIILVSLVIF